jgi:Ca2+/Na+ antiporter
MIHQAKQTFNKLSTRFQVKKPWDNVIIFLLNILIAIPVFIIIRKNIIDFNWYFKLDSILLFLIILVVIQLVLRAMRRITLISIFLYLIALLFGTIFQKYGFQNVIEDYNSMLFTMNDNPNPQDIIIEKLLPFPNKSKVVNAIEFENPRVRDFAIIATTKNFRKVKGYSQYRVIIQCFAVFKEINSHWNYVSDPKNHEYIARASESVRLLSGDCDDHSILMAACVKSIGGTPRLIHTDGHMYPELLIGRKSDLESINYLIKNVLFVQEAKGKQLHYHIDERGNVWLNLDYTDKYPGGKFMSKAILGALTLD